MGSVDAAWNDLNKAVLSVFADAALNAGEVRREMAGVPDRHVRTALHQLTDLDYLTSARGAVHTTYTITEAGKRHLAAVMEVA
ncbi:MAG: hypothetical protein JWO57_1729 [Pseudonocardiales bacterium]|nr:hypothetical protein [Pseudonocardiales bacterium]